MATSASFVRYRPYLGYRASQVLTLVRTEIEASGVAPSYDQICDALGISTRGEVSQIVDVLERRGLLRRVGKGHVRRIRLTVVKG